MPSLIARKGNNITLSNNVRVTDPCYTPDTWCAEVIENVKPGSYNTYMYEDNTENRVALVSIWHESVGNPTNLYQKMQDTELSIGVDSGQAGFADDAYYKSLHKSEEKHDKWYFNQLKTFGDKDIPLTDEEITLCEEYQTLSNQLYMTFTDEQFNEWYYNLHQFEKKLLHKHRILFPNSSLNTKTKSISANFLSTPDNQCAFTQSGYGDGGYPLYIYTDDSDRVVGMAIDFLDVIENGEI